MRIIRVAFFAALSFPCGGSALEHSLPGAGISAMAVP